MGVPAPYHAQIPLAILVVAGVHGLSTWLSLVSKATSMRKSPHGLSAWWISLVEQRFVVYYRAFGCETFLE